MAFSHTQTKQSSATSVTTLTITPTSALSANHLLVVNIKFASGTPTSINVTDNATTPNTYNSVGTSASGASSTVYQYYGVQITGGATTVTISWTGSASIRATMDEFSGNAATNAAVFDQAHTTVGTGSAAAVSTFSPAATGELISASISMTGATSVSAGTGYTLSQSSTSQACEYKLAGNASESAPMTINGTSQSWVEIVGAYAPAAAVVSSSGQFFAVL